MYEHQLYAQNPDSGDIGRILEGVAQLASTPHDEFDAAVAYASSSGCKALTEKLAAGQHWSGSKKRLLISIDFGRTEPAALDLLAAMGDSEVRVPNGRAIVGVQGFRPPFVFHPKVYLTKHIDDSNTKSVGLFVGSGNLTLSGLVTGVECGSLQRWTAQPRAVRHNVHLAHLQSSLEWFETMWRSADPLAVVLPDYKKAWKQPHATAMEDAADAAELYCGTIHSVKRGIEAIRLSKARALWVETDTLYKNRGVMKAGNQLDLPRGLRVFFGFPATDVPRNTIFGKLSLQCDAFDPVIQSMRFGNNKMDKINLPIPDKDGPVTYDNAIVLFERQSADPSEPRRFLVRVGTQNDLSKWKKAAVLIPEGEMHGGRRYGLLF